MNRITVGLAIATLVCVATPGFANTDVESELAKMREAMEGLQDQVQAQQEQLKHQKGMLEDAQTAVRAQQEQSESLSGLSQFLDMIEVDGHVAGSYNYNFNTPEVAAGGAGLNSGLFGHALPFHPDHNTFVVDQVWFGLGKSATEESPAGFRFDILYGNTANFLGQGTGFEANFNEFPTLADEDELDDILSLSSPLGRRYTAFDSTSDYYVAQAYVEYTCGCIGDGTNFKFGKWQTPVGAEVVQTTGNFNVTRGIVYQLLQPVDHLGLIVTQQLGNFQVGGGVVNSGASGISSPDINREKSYIGTAAIGDDRMSLRGTFVYGAEEFAEQDSNSGLADVTAWFNPADNVSMWANYNYAYVEGTGTRAHGIAVAGRVGITDQVGVALRGEYVNLHLNDPGMRDYTEFYALTGTVDYSLTDHLMVRGEVRFDWVHDTQLFFENDVENNFNSGDFADNQTVGLVEVVYEF